MFLCLLVRRILLGVVHLSVYSSGFKRESDQSDCISPDVNHIRGKSMVTAKKTPLDIMDHIYSVAYWLTGSESEATELVNRTYLNVGIESSETEVFKTFRACYLDTLDHDCTLSLPEKPSCSMEAEDKALLLKQDADIRLSVLLSAISGLKHRAISRIIGKPLDTIRVWLSSGRKALAYSACLKSWLL